MMAACEKDNAPQSRPSTNVAPPMGATATAGSCPATGQWAPCSILDRLDHAGLAPRVDSEPATEPPLSRQGLLVHVGRADLELFIYADSNARLNDEKKLDKRKFVEIDAEPGINQEPTLIRSVNLLGILKSINDHQRERVSDAITAGPPQPAS